MEKYLPKEAPWYLDEKYFRIPKNGATLRYITHKSIIPPTYRSHKAIECVVGKFNFNIISLIYAHVSWEMVTLLLFAIVTIGLRLCTRLQIKCLVTIAATSCTIFP